MRNLVVEKYPVKGGKTTKALEKVLELLKEGKSVTYVTVELTKEDVKNRLLNLATVDIPFSNLKILVVYETDNLIEFIQERTIDSEVDTLVIDSYIDISKNKDIQDAFDSDTYIYTQCARA